MKIAHIALLTTLLVPFAAAADAEDGLRSGTPKDCFLNFWGKGPNWATKVSTEFQMSLLQRKMPGVDQNCSEKTEKGLFWEEKTKEPTITTIASVDGRRVIQVVYPDENGSFGKIDTIMLAIQTAKDSEWYSPFFVAEPELYSGLIVSGKDVAFGYLATLEWHGSGSEGQDHLFDLRQPHPKLVSVFSYGRVPLRKDYDSDAEHKEAMEEDIKRRREASRFMMESVIPAEK